MRRKPKYVRHGDQRRAACREAMQGLYFYIVVLLDYQGWASECPDVKNYKLRLNLVWHIMVTVSVKGIAELAQPTWQRESSSTGSKSCHASDGSDCDPRLPHGRQRTWRRWSWTDEVHVDNASIIVAYHRDTPVSLSRSLPPIYPRMR